MDKINQILESKGIAITKPRVIILQHLLSKHMHVTPSELHVYLNRFHKISKATIYNTLNLFTNHHLLKKIYLYNGSCFYDSNVKKHYHIYDTTTHSLKDIPIDDMLSISEIAELYIDKNKSELIKSEVLFYTKSLDKV